MYADRQTDRTRTIMQTLSKMNNLLLLSVDLPACDTSDQKPTSLCQIMSIVVFLLAATFSSSEIHLADISDMICLTYHVHAALLHAQVVTELYCTELKVAGGCCL